MKKKNNYFYQHFMYRDSFSNKNLFLDSGAFVYIWMKAERNRRTTLKKIIYSHCKPAKKNHHHLIKKVINFLFSFIFRSSSFPNHRFTFSLFFLILHKMIELRISFIEWKHKRDYISRILLLFVPSVATITSRTWEWKSRCKISHRRQIQKKVARRFFRLFDDVLRIYANET